MSTVTVHLVTQDDQPFGSERKCCEVCGRGIHVMQHGSEVFVQSRQQLALVLEHGIVGMTAVQGKTPVTCDSVIEHEPEQDYVFRNGRQL